MRHINLFQVHEFHLERALQQALGHDDQSMETETNVTISQDGQTIEAGPGANRTVAEVIQSFVQVQQVLDKTSARWAIVLLVKFSSQW